MTDSKSDFRDRVISGLAERRKAKDKANAQIIADYRRAKKVRYLQKKKQGARI
jgi:hypothetical protein